MATDYNEATFRSFRNAEEAAENSRRTVLVHVHSLQEKHAHAVANCAKLVLEQRHFQKQYRSPDRVEYLESKFTFVSAGAVTYNATRNRTRKLDRTRDEQILARFVHATISTAFMVLTRSQHLHTWRSAQFVAPQQLRNGQRESHMLKKNTPTDRPPFDCICCRVK